MSDTATAPPRRPTTGPQMTIDGRSVGTETTITVVNPSTGRSFAEVPACTPAILEMAVGGADAAFDSWSAMPITTRRDLVGQALDRIDAATDELARLLTLEQGKPLVNARSEVQSGLRFSRAFGDMSLAPEVVVDDDTQYIEIQRVPLGVVAAITAWNYPVMLALLKIAPALIAGNTVVVKPSPYTPVATLRLGELLADLFPPGVLQVIGGDDEIGRKLTGHPQIAKISFTGSVATGRAIMAAAAPTLKRLTLELGGNDAGIVLNDFDAQAMGESLYWAALSNNGQVCAGLKRLYLPRSLADDVCDRLAQIAGTVTVGDGMAEGTQTGPVQNRVQLDRVRELLDDALSHGAQVVYQGDVPDGDGFFFPITIVRGVAEGVRLVDEEPFGPVLPVLIYDDLDDVVRRANDSDYGLGASVWTSDSDAAQDVAKRLQAGTVWVNRHPHLTPEAPFGGVKQSGLGVESSRYGLQAYTDSKVLNIKRS